MSKDVLATLIENTMKKQNLVTFMYDNEKNIDDNKCGTTILTSHKRETPHIAQTDCRTSRSQDKTNF